MNKYANLKEKYNDLTGSKLSAVENAKEFLTEIEKNNEKYNIFIEINKNLLKEAEKLDLKFKNGEKIGKLFGLCFAIKSNISVKGMNISCSSNTLKNYKAPFDADVIKKIKDEDGLIIGIVGNDEFACGSSGESSTYGKIINPYSPSRIPGGSSSGSAAAVSANMCDIALGSDTGGSIRNPASHCHVIGIKPSYGRVSRFGLIDLSMSLDQIGPFSKDLFGSALVMNVISGKSSNDATTIDEIVIDNTKIELKEKYNIGIIKSFLKLIKDENIKKIYLEWIEKLRKEGHNIIELDIKNIDLAIQAYYPIVYTEFFSGTRKFDGVKYGLKIEESCGEEVLRRILGGKEISRSEFDGAYYKKALKVKEILENEFKKAFKEVDFIIAPTTPMLPHKFGTKLTPEEMYSYDAFTIPANLAGICGGVIPANSIKEDGENISIGIQVFSDKFKENMMFQGLKLIESLK